MVSEEVLREAQLANLWPASRRPHVPSIFAYNAIRNLYTTMKEALEAHNEALRELAKAVSDLTDSYGEVLRAIQEALNTLQ